VSELRRALAADAAAIAGVDVRAWCHAYGSFLDEQRLAERTTEMREQRWRDVLAADDSETWLLEAGGRIAGFATIGPGRDEDAGAATGEIYALYVDPPAQGAGAGTRLLDGAERRLAQLGSEQATLWTFSDNGLARAFYERHGWGLDATPATSEACESWAPAVRYRRGLSQPHAKRP
jgi:GNAT superfamily N-acetyltransferase